MRQFASLLDCLVYTQSRNRKVALLGHYFRTAPDPDRGWALAALTDGVPIRLPLRRMLSDLVTRFIDPTLYRLSRDYVGDTAETVALLWPEGGIPFQSKDASAASSSAADKKPDDKENKKPKQLVFEFTPTPNPSPQGGGDSPSNAAAPHPNPLPVKNGERESPFPSEGTGGGCGDIGHNSGEAPGLSLGAVIEAMATGSTHQRTERLGHLLNQLDASGRWALLKLLGGAPRVGVSARLARTALAESYGRDVSEIEEIWHALEPPYLELFQWLDGKAERPDPGAKPVFRPVMLAHPIEEEDWPRLSPEDFAAEWKWDGIRVQVAARGGDVRMFSRQGDDISGAFPEIRSAFQGHDCVVDGELLIMRDGVIAPFNDLQQRLNRKSVTAKMMSSYPPHVRLYDLLFDGAEDLRALSFGERRERLEAWHAKHHPRLTDVSPLVAFKSFEELGELWSSARAEGIEGLMLKRRASVYQPGRVKGEWFKWKRAALTLDCVLMYAQRGSGKRSSYYSDYTFGVWRTDENGERQLVPVGKAYSGFTDEELLLIDKWIRGHTTETFGPVRAVEPELVFEVAFDAVQESTRHKSGVAMRFPRIHRIRWDKPAAEADTLESVLKLMSGGATAVTAAAPSDLV
ncbi:cisplatin damage response ATP-dependent DNA ligase [Hyphomicrobium sp.]|uniref:cisplatin damage response ATP-dependent DNA ligase n=1 Tax=Hyphomicrobium sp. TaxID=82 RepID=UPI002D78515C|nr:cisplatin damage response ATP-dependent DNA ligase [Hyphomicrobium sp.]HET6391157.1 cisplatin damage response ATP-dependent DNA ligase [Hyphomicrobium sp.]